MTELILVRHGQTDSNVAGRFMGQSDVGLNAEGHRQALLLARCLAQCGAGFLYTSDLRRAVQTARILGETLGLEPTPLSELREIDVGRAVGMTREELCSEHPEIFGDSWIDTPFPGGESYSQLALRVGRALRSLLERHDGETVVAVVHGGAIRAGVASLTGIPLESMFGMTIANASITRLRALDANDVSLDMLSDTTHLESKPGSVKCEP